MSRERARETKTIPVFDRDGTVLLYDMYLDGKWIGSRRTLPQCAESFAWEASHAD